MAEHDCKNEAYDPACAECVRHDETCGKRCGTCNERMCEWFGPEPAITTCAAHYDECQSCNGDNPCRQCAEARRAA